LTLLLETPTDDSVEVAIAFLKESGQKLSEVSPRGIHAIFERLRHVLHESLLDKRTQYMIEVMFQVRKDGFKDNPAVMEDLDLVEDDDQFTHMITLDDVTNGEEILNVFKHDPEYEDNESKYGAIKKELLEESSDDGKSGSSSSGSSSDDSDDDEGKDVSAPILDQTETNLISLRRTIYLTIQVRKKPDISSHGQV
jgi:pre-mRNA-splicing factor CWC22